MSLMTVQCKVVSFCSGRTTKWKNTDQTHVSQIDESLRSRAQIEISRAKDLTASETLTCQSHIFSSKSDTGRKLKTQT